LPRNQVSSNESVNNNHRFLIEVACLIGYKRQTIGRRVISSNQNVANVKHSQHNALSP